MFSNIQAGCVFLDWSSLFHVLSHSFLLGDIPVCTWRVLLYCPAIDFLNLSSRNLIVKPLRIVYHLLQWCFTFQRYQKHSGSKLFKGERPLCLCNFLYFNKMVSIHTQTFLWGIYWNSGLLCSRSWKPGAMALPLGKSKWYLACIFIKAKCPLKECLFWVSCHPHCSSNSFQLI